MVKEREYFNDIKMLFSKANIADVSENNCFHENYVFWIAILIAFS